VAKAICETAALARANVICVGTRGLGGVAAAVLGSVAQAVIAQSKVPVLAVPAPQK
jgi:nucleotide-binding universal stress UspA family protein